VFLRHSRSTSLQDRFGMRRPLRVFATVQPVLPAGSCPLRSESDLHPALPRNDAMGHLRTCTRAGRR
jgi:hypothetical protein